VAIDRFLARQGFAAVDFPKSMRIEHDMIDPANHPPNPATIPVSCPRNSMTFVAIKIGGDALLRPTGLRAAASWLLLAAVIALSGCHKTD